MMKMKLKKTVLSLLAFFMLTTTSCNQKIQEQPQDYTPNETDEVISKDYQRSSSEAIEIISMKVGSGAHWPLLT